MKSIFEQSQEGQHAYSLPKEDSAFHLFQPPSHLLRHTPIKLPEVSELDLTRHFSNLARRNVGIDTTFYPLGSCTMKLNPRINEICATLIPFVQAHPLAPDDTVQGSLQLIDEMTKLLCDICGMDAGTLLPCAGAQGELTGLQMIAAYHRHRGDKSRTEVLVPDDAHGTNPATAAMAGFKTIVIPSTPQGEIDIEALKAAVSPRTAALMMTNPSTLGLFNSQIKEVAAIVHQHGGLLYYDGANLNALLQIVRPGDMGFDVMHLNLHKTFSTPHGGGGPGSGPVLCNNKLKSYLPLPFVAREENEYRTVWEDSLSIGKMVTFHGHFGIYLRAYAYAKMNGLFGLRRIAEIAVLNANYLKTKLAPLFKVPFPQSCMHEFVLQADNFVDQGVRALDIAKRLLDYGVHAPTIYFPLIVKECMLIEPTEAESKATLDLFVEIMEKIVQEIKTDPNLVKHAPHNQVVTRLDEVRAARQPILKDK